MIAWSRGFGIVLCGLASLVAAPSLARADNAAVDKLELHGVRDTGKQLDREIRDALVEQHLTVVPAERVAAVQKGDPKLAACTTPACSRRLAAAVDARWIVHVRVGFDKSDYDISMSLFDSQGGRALPPLTDRCVLCGWTELRTRIGTLAHALAALTVVDTSPPEVAAHSAAAPATTTPADKAAPAAAATTAVTPPPGDAPSSGTSFIGVSKWIAGVLAVGLITTGAVLLAYDGRTTFNDGSACDLTKLGGATQCPYTNHSALAGGILVGAGGLAAAGTVALFVLDAKHVPAPAVVPTHGGATITLTAHF